MRRPSFQTALAVPGALAALISCWRLGAAPLSDSEAFYAEIAREMHARGDWLTPMFNFARFFDKPPLYYWLELAAFHLFGPTEMSARLPCALAFAATAALTSAAGMLLFDEWTGLVAGCLLATTMGFFVYAHTALIEPVLCFWVTAALVSFLAWRAQPNNRMALYAAYIAAALGMLTKGLTGVVFPASVIVVACAAKREAALLRRAFSPAGLLLFALVVLPWHVWSAVHHPGFLWFHFIHEQLLRFSGSMLVVYHPFPTPIFLGSMVLMIFPWSIYLPQALLGPWNIWRGPRAMPGWSIVFAQAWAGVILLFFCLSNFKLDYYSIPAWPPLMLLVAQYLTSQWRSHEIKTGTWVPAAIVAALGALGLAALPWITREFGAQIPDAGLLDGGRLTFAFLLAGGAAALAAFALRRPAIALACLATMMLPTFLLAERGMSLLEPEMSSGAVARAAAACLDRLGRGELVQGESEEDIYVAGVNFYTGRKVWLVKKRENQSFPFPHTAQERFFVTPEELAVRWTAREPLLLIDESGIDEGKPWEANGRLIHLVWRNRRHRLIANQPICGAP